MTWNNLKKISIDDLERIIGEAVSKHTNEKYGCSINGVKYDTLSKLEARIEIYTDYPADHEFGPETEE
jgi:hypothetical protein